MPCHVRGPPLPSVVHVVWSLVVSCGLSSSRRLVVSSSHRLIVSCHAIHVVSCPLFSVSSHGVSPCLLHLTASSLLSSRRLSFPVVSYRLLSCLTTSCLSFCAVLCHVVLCPLPPLLSSPTSYPLSSPLVSSHIFHSWFDCRCKGPCCIKKHTQKERE